MVTGSDEEECTSSCKVPELLLNTEQDKQWKQIGQDASGLRLQCKFVRKSKGISTTFCVEDIRATAPPASASAAASSPSSRA